MYKILKTFKLKGSVLAQSFFGEKFCAVDQNLFFYVVDLQTLKFEKSVALEKTPQGFHRFSRNACANSCGQISHTNLEDKSSRIVHYDDDKLKVTFKSQADKDKIVCISLSKSGKYFATGLSGGDVFIYKTSNKFLEISCERVGDYAKDILFDDKENLCCITYFNKFFQVIDILSGSVMFVGQADEIAEKILFTKDGVILLLKNGNVSLFDLKTKNITSNKNIINGWISAASFCQNDDYFALGSREGDFVILRTADFEIISKYFFENGGVSSLSCDGEFLGIGLTDGSLQIIDMESRKKEVLLELGVENLKKASEIAQNNIFLNCDLDVNEKLNQMWSKSLEEAIEKIRQNKFEDILTQMSIFMVNEERKKEIMFYLSQKGEYASFCEAVEKKELAKAYAAVERNQYFTKTTHYEILEENWEKIYKIAKNIALGNDNDKNILLKKIFSQFSDISCKKSLIDGVMKTPAAFTKSEELVKLKRFSEFFNLCEANPFLKETFLYKKVSLLTQGIVDKLLQMFNGRDFENFFKNARQLIGFTPIKQSVEQLIEEANIINKFLDLQRMGSLNKAMELANENKSDFLKITPEYQKILDNFEQDYVKSQIFAAEGKPIETKNSIDLYLDVKFFGEKILTLMKTAYINEIKNSSIRGYDLDCTVEIYVKYFGKDVFMEKFIQNTDAKQKYESCKNVKSLLYKTDGFPDSIINT